jgi:ELWxxDGT repeat protein
MPAGAPLLSGMPLLFSSTTLPDLTVLGGKALFDGFDINGNLNLWVTDGTSAGTSLMDSACFYRGPSFIKSIF